MGTRTPRHPDPQTADPCVDDFDAHAAWAVAEWPEIDPDVEVIVNRVSLVHRHIERGAVDTLSELGLAQGELKVLLALARGHRAHGEIAHDLLVSTGTMTNRLDKLEAAGFVTRHPDPDDRRGVIVELTPEGREVLDRYVAVQGKRERQLFADMSPEDRNRLAGLLRQALASVEGQSGSAIHSH